MQYISCISITQCHKVIDDSRNPFPRHTHDVGFKYIYVITIVVLQLQCNVNEYTIISSAAMLELKYITEMCYTI
jgi:hypothetical protein